MQFPGCLSQLHTRLNAASFINLPEAMFSSSITLMDALPSITIHFPFRQYIKETMDDTMESSYKITQNENLAHCFLLLPKEEVVLFGSP